MRQAVSARHPHRRSQQVSPTLSAISGPIGNTSFSCVAGLRGAAVLSPAAPQVLGPGPPGPSGIHIYERLNQPVGLTVAAARSTTYRGSPVVPHTIAVPVPILKVCPGEYVFSPWRAPSLILASLPRNLYHLPLLLFNCRCGSPSAFPPEVGLEVCAVPRRIL